MSAIATELLFPVFLKLRKKRVLVVGGGGVAFDKVRALLSVQADVEVVAPNTIASFASLGVPISLRPFRADDVDGAWLVVAAATREVNREVVRAADRVQRFVVAVDDPDAATAYGAATFERGGVTFALSSNGRAPALVALLRRALERVLPDDLDAWRALAESTRAQWKESRVPIAARTPLLLDALNALYRRPDPNAEPS